jgi:hypothetical protein
MSNEVFLAATKNIGAIAATVEAEMSRLDQLASVNAVAEHMSRVHSANLKELGERLDAAQEAVAVARHQQRNAEATAQQVLSNARAEAAAIKIRAEREAMEIIAGARAKVAAAHNQLAA